MKKKTIKRISVLANQTVGMFDLRGENCVSIADFYCSDKTKLFNSLLRSKKLRLFTLDYLFHSDSRA